MICPSISACAGQQVWLAGRRESPLAMRNTCWELGNRGENVSGIGEVVMAHSLFFLGTSIHFSMKGVFMSSNTHMIKENLYQD
jgi:hypothetical protein